MGMGRGCPLRPSLGPPDAKVSETHREQGVARGARLKGDVLAWMFLESGLEGPDRIFPQRWTFLGFL